VLDGLTFTFEAGRINVILGPGGTGKSTLLRALGADPGAAASPWVDGELLLPEVPAVSMGQKPRPRPESLDRLLASEGAAAAGVLRTIWRSAPEVAELLESVLDRGMDQLSYTQVRLAELTVTLSRGPFVLLDEPEVGLTDEIREAMIRCLGDHRGSRTVILATHHLGLARTLADYALLLSDGKVVESGPNPPFFDRPRHARTRQFVTMGS
jgi:ABC-type multidrug transport system ATPase subunit